MDHTDQVIAESIDYLAAHYQEQPELAFLARRAGYEATHFQKLFKERVGISPKRMLQYMNLRHARDLLANGHSTMDAAMSAGLSGTGRLYDLFVTCEAVTPGDVQHKGRGLQIIYGYHPTPLGEIMIGQTERGVCYLGFLVDQDRAVPLARMKKHLPFASYRHNDGETAASSENILAIWRGDGDERVKLRLDIHGTNLQIQVWQALLRIPCGETTDYKTIAAQIGKPKAARAVGNAVGSNPVSLLIPCHRVIQSTGVINNYGWGNARKKILLGIESDMVSPGGDEAQRTSG